MMKKLLFIISIVGGLSLSAQVTDGEKALKTQNKDTTQGWKKGGVFSANFTQVSLTNWAAGGQSSVSLNGLLDLFANYKKGNSAWDNNLTLGYGETQLGGSDWFKSDDRILLNSKYGKKASKDWYYAGLLNFRSQFAPGFTDATETTKNSDFLAPGYLLGAIGMDYKPSDNFTVFVSPFTAKLTVVNIQTLADEGAFGVDAAEFDAAGNKTKDGSTTRLEIGGYVRMMYKRKIMENVNYQTNLDIFSNYSENPQNLDITWDNLLSMKINKYLTTTITTSLIYDDDIDIDVQKSDGTPKFRSDGVTPEIGPRTQFKYVLAIGFQYKFGDK